jgi:hypothetical protein
MARARNPSSCALKLEQLQLQLISGLRGAARLAMHPGN